MDTKRSNFFYAIVLCWLGSLCFVNAQSNVSGGIAFISDCQQPMTLEKLFVKPYRNREGRDSLFSDILKQRFRVVFMTGDLTSAGSDDDSWQPVDRFLSNCKKQNTEVHGIPGNHEYFRKSPKGIRNFLKRFPHNALTGYCIKYDSVAMVMLNSNLKKLSDLETRQQQTWYLQTMNKLDADKSVRVIVVGAHHSPYTNSKVVDPSKEVAVNFIPAFEASPKAKLFISGHSHNLEYFENASHKHFLVIGGGGGLTQPLKDMSKRLFTDLIPQNKKPLYFYVTLKRVDGGLIINARGLTSDFERVKDFDISRIE